MTQLESLLITMTLGPPIVRIAAGLEKIVEPVSCCGEALQNFRSSLGTASPASAAAQIAGRLHDMPWSSKVAQQHRLELWVPTVACCLATASDTSRGIEAVAIGLEVAVLLSAGLSSSIPDETWDADGIAGGVAAALACARVIGLSHAETASTLAMSAAQAPRFSINAGARLRSHLIERTAAASLEAAFVGRSGLSAPNAPLTGERGLLAVLGSGRFDPPDEQGDVWLSESLFGQLFSDEVIGTDTERGLL